MDLREAAVWFLAAMLLYLTLPTMAVMVMGTFGIGGGARLPTQWAMLAQAAGQLAVIAIGLAVRSDMGRGRWAWWLALPAYALVFIPWNGITNAYMNWLQGDGREVKPQEALRALADLPLAGWGFWIMVVGAVVLAPLAEEILYRGFLRDLLRPTGAVTAGIVTSVLFGLAHGLEFAFPLALLGGFLFWLRHRSGGLWAPILAHAVHNGLAVLMVRLLPDLLPLKPD